MDNWYENDSLFSKLWISLYAVECFFCIAYHENGALIWYDNGKNDTLSKLEWRGTVIKKVEYRITCRLN